MNNFLSQLSIWSFLSISVINLIWTRSACYISYLSYLNKISMWSSLSIFVICYLYIIWTRSHLSILSDQLSNRDSLDNNAGNGRDPSSLWETMTRLYYRAAHYGTQCQGCLIDAQTPSGMFVTPRDERDEEISWPTGSIWGGMCPACALFPDLEGLMPMMAHQLLFSGSMSGIWASTELCYGKGK